MEHTFVETSEERLVERKALEPVIEDEEVKERKIKRFTLVGRILVGLMIIGCWELFTHIRVLDPYYWSKPSTITQTAWVAFTDGNLLRDIGFTSSATILGFVCGTTIGAIIGLSFWWSRLYANISEPYIVAFNALPKLALAPVIVILLGIGFFSKVVLAFTMTVIVTALAAYSGVKEVDKDLEKLLFSLGAKRRQVFSKVVIPSSLPWIISSLRINIALALAGAIVGEFIASREGVGRMILYAGQVMDNNLVWVGVVVLSILSLLMYGGVAVLERLLLKGLQNRSN